MAVKEYSFLHVPTVKKFCDDRSFMSAITGPFRSGKSAGCVIKLFQLAKQQAPGPDGVRRSRWAIVRNCFDDQTEILTENRGWQFFTNLLPTDRVATRRQDGTLYYALPNKLCTYDYFGEMIGCRLENIDFLVTPDHKLYISRINGRNKVRSPYEQRYASEVYGKTNVEFETTVNYTGGDSGFSESEFEFLGFWFAEGSAGNYKYKNRIKASSRWNVTQKKYKLYVECLLNSVGLRYNIVNKGDGCNTYVLNTDGYENLFNICLLAGKSIDRSIPIEIKNAPRNHLRAFIRGYLMGDGHIKNRAHDVTRAWTSSGKLADDIQEIAFKAGYATTLSYRNRFVKRFGRFFDQYVITFLTEKRCHPQPRRNNGKTPWYKVNYDGKIYCVEMPECVVCVRRNGKHHWSIRSMPQLRDTTIPTVFDWLEELGEYHKSENDFVLNKIQADDGSPVEAYFHFRPLDTEKDKRNLLSLEVTGAWFNEAKEISKGIVDVMRGRVGQYPSQRNGGATWGGIIMDTNPPDTDHWFYKLFEENLPKYCPECRDAQGGIILHIEGKCPICGGIDGTPYIKLFRQPSGRKPGAENLQNLVPGYYANLAAGMDKGFIKVYVDGEYGYSGDGRAVYSLWDDDKYLRQESIPMLKQYPLIVGFDNTGRDQAAIICQYLPTGQMRALHEFVVVNTGTRNLVRNIVKPFILSHYPGCSLILTGDPAGVKASDTDDRNTFQEISEAFGIEATPARSNAISARTDSVESLMRKFIGENNFGLLVSSEGCPLLTKGFRGEYRLRRLQVVGKDYYTDKPEKNLASHIHDAFQYACMAVEDALTLVSSANGELWPSSDSKMSTENLGWAAFL